MRILGAGLVLAAIAGFVGSAAAQDWRKEWTDVQARAKGSSLALAHHQNTGFEPAVAEFKRRFPDIKVESTSISAVTLGQRVITEQRNGLYVWDTWWAPTGNMNTVVLPAGGFDKITDYFVLPEVSELSNWRAPQMLYTSDRGPYIFLHNLFVERAIYVNDDVVRGLDINSPLVMVDPRLKGKIATRTPDQQNASSFGLGGVLKEVGANGADFLRRLHRDMDMQVIDNPRQLTDTVLRGEKAMAIGASHDVVAQCRAEGGCKAVRRAPFGEYVLTAGIAVLKNAPHKDATKVWVNWILSKEGQEAYVKGYAEKNDAGALSARKDVEPHPKHVDGAPDYANIGKYLVTGTDSGDQYIRQAINIAIEAKNR